MKTQNIFLQLNLLLSIIIIVGCMPSTESMTTLPTVLPTVPASTISPTKTMMPTLTPVVLDTLTTVPTLPIEQARQRLLDLLTNNGNCLLPCLWGITPGKSTSQDAQAILSPLISIRSIYDIEPGFDSKRGRLSPDFVEGTQMLHTKVYYLSDKQIVRSIRFNALEWKEYVASNGSPGLAYIFDSKIFGKRVEYYSLSHVLSEQGIPASVMIDIFAPDSSGGFDIVLLYPNQGIWVHYTTQKYVVGNTVKGCPSNAHVELELYPPGNPDSFFSQLDNTNWGITKSSYKPLEEATSMSVEKFYETFRNPTDKCIEAPVKLWPTPQPGGG